MTKKTELEKALTALYLEVDESIVIDLKQKVQQAKSEWCKAERIRIAKKHGYKEGTIGYKNIVEI